MRGNGTKAEEEIRMRKKMTAKKWTVVALIICLISMIGTSFVQTCNQKIKIKSMKWESPQGCLLSADLWIPPNATADTPAPCIITVEGWYNNKEMQDMYNVELSRRGYVVLTLDMHGHGNSEALPSDCLYEGAVGVDAAVQLAATLPYVDVEKIGVTGHSSGGTAANMAVAIDNERENPLIACVLEQAGDWQDDTGGDHSGDYGSRSVGIIASEYDDFYFGTYDEEGNMLTTPKQFMKTDGAKKFLNFNEEPNSGFEAEAGKYYTKDFDGKESVRVIYRPTCIHPAVTISSKCAGYAIDFFEKTLGAPHPLAATNQIWQWKTAFNTLGLVGFFLFVIFFTLAMLDTEYFKILNANGEVQPVAVTNRQGKAWFWGSTIASVIFSGACFLFCIEKVYSNTTEFFSQTGPLTIGAWSAACGLFAILLMVLSYQMYGKKNGVSLRESGVLISRTEVWKTLLLGLLVVVVSILIVFCGAYFFKADFRIWILAIKAFDADKVVIALRYLPMFLLFYMAHSVSMNCFNYNTIGGKKGNTVLLCFANSLAPIVLTAAQYIYFYVTSRQLFGLSEGERIAPIWLIPIIFILFGAALMSRIVYKKTRNPYIAGLINAMLVTIISCSNTFTTLSAGSMICTTF